MSRQDHHSSTPAAVRDRYRTPQYLFNYFDDLFHFTRDVCAENEEIALCSDFIDPETDGLLTPWGKPGDMVWCNPPYSDQESWIICAIENALKGVGSALLLPTFNGQDYWTDIAANMTGLVNIIGRVSFIAAEDFYRKGKLIRKGDEVPGNTSGSCVVLFGTKNTGALWVRRDEMKTPYEMQELLK